MAAMIRIVAPHFVAGWCTDRCAPIVGYMRGWTAERVLAYCRRRDWRAEYV